jgi:hypothetical protein
MIILFLLTGNNVILVGNSLKNKKINALVGFTAIAGFNYLIYKFLSYFNIIDSTFFYWLSIPAFVLATITYIVVRKEKITLSLSKQIVLSHNKGEIVYRNPYNGFLIYGGAEAGKTASVGKPLLKEYMRNGFAGFIYDAKENDYTLTALNIKEKIGYPYPIYNLDFIHPDRSYRTNIFCPGVIKEPMLVAEFAEVFFSSFLKEGEKQNEWYDMALGAFKGVAWVFFNDYPEYCSLPHICNFIVHSEPEKLLEVIQKNDVAKTYAGALINSQYSEKTFASILTTMGKYISDFSANKNACYILSGDDFLYNPLDVNNPKMICVSNHFIARNIISPLVVLLFSTIAKQIRYGNTVPFVFFMDEATTFKIPNLESYPSELREYLVAFVLLTQSASKIEKQYQKYDRSSLESNLANQFYGWTADTIALDNYAKQFSKLEEKTKSFTIGEKSRSTTTGTRKEIRYDGEFFGGLKPGEFVGKAKNANVKTFHTRFKQYDGGKLAELPIIRDITQIDIENNYKKIIEEVKNIK